METNYYKSLFGGIIGILILIMICIGLSNMYVHVNAGEQVVVQSVGIFGKATLTWHHDPGWKWQGWGKVTRYARSFQYWFSSKSDQGETHDQSIKCRFNDAGSAWISGSVRVDMPNDDKCLTDLHIRYGSESAVEQQLIRTVMEKAVYMSGPMMSSKESYAERRNDLLTLIEDQAANGVYQTDTVNQEIIDPITGDKRKAAVVKIRRDEGSKVLRQEQSPLSQFGVRLFNLSINEIKYDESVEKQIGAQREATMQVQTAIANAKRAEQDALTAAKQGEANAAKAKWDQETMNAKMVAEADGRMKAAELDKKAAEFQKAAMILKGEGEAKARELVMSADGALEKKLGTYERVMGYFADAIKDSRQPIVPSVIMGGASGNGGTAADWLSIMGIKAAKDLGLEMQMEKNRKP